MVHTSGERGPDPDERQFADFIRMLTETKEPLILIHKSRRHREQPGRTRVESLNRFADAEKNVAIVTRKIRQEEFELPVNPPLRMRVIGTAQGETK